MPCYHPKVKTLGSSARNLIDAKAIYTCGNIYVHEIGTYRFHPDIPRDDQSCTRALPVGLPVARIGSRLAIRPAYRQDGRGECSGSVSYQISRLVGRAVAEDIIDIEGEGTGGEIIHYEVDVRDCVRADGVGDGETEDTLDVVVFVQLAGDAVEDSVDERPSLVKIHVEVPICEHGRDARVVERVPLLVSRIGQLLFRYTVDAVDVEVVDSDFVEGNGDV